MANLTLLISSSPAQSQGSYSAYRFAQAAVASGHQIRGIFFYAGGADNANGLQVHLSQERNMFKLWQQLSQQLQIPLMVCVSAANRRGVINQESAEQHDLTQYSLLPPFTEVGLGELAVLRKQSDKVVQF